MPRATADAQRVAIYIRTTRTDRGGHGFSVYGQRLAINAYIKMHGDGFAVDAEYIDESGASAHRPEWHRLVTASQAGLFDALLVLHSSRISRDEFVLKHYMKHFLDLGVAVVPVASADQLPETVDEVRGWFALQAALRELDGADESFDRLVDVLRRAAG
jgi:DNA invertase Pin-like site-specific DNA recombinase